MYKIILVDDEYIVREGMKKKIEWEELGFILSGTYEDGKKAIEAVEEIKPDVVITDIYMPFVDGIGLADYIYNKYPEIKVIILTGYNSIEYIQKSIKLNVYDYVLKPVTAKELNSMIIKIKGELDKIKEEKEKIFNLQKIVYENMPVIKNKFLLSLVGGQKPLESIDRKLALFDIELSDKNYIAILDIDEGYVHSFFVDEVYSNNDYEIIYFTLYNVCEELIRNKNAGVTFQRDSEETIIIFTHGDVQSIIKTLEEIKDFFEKNLKITLTIGFSNSFDGVGSIKNAYSEAVKALNFRFLTGNNRIIFLEEIEKSFYVKKQISIEDKNLILALKTSNSKEIEAIINNIIQELKEANISVLEGYIYIQQIILSIKKSLDEIEIDTSHINLTDIYKFKTLEEIQEWIKSLCFSICDMIKETKDNYNKTFSIKAKEYLEVHYNDQDLSINSVCKHLSVSISHFSASFKNDTNETFTEYLTKLRIEKAKQLLLTTNLRAYDIAYKVGYNDPQYFYSVFKKQLGVTPTNFRERGESK